MSAKSVLKLIEIRTLVAGFFPVLLGSVYSLYTYQRINVVFLISLIIAMALVQSATNMFNDFMDFKRGTDRQEKMEEKVLVDGSLKPNQVLALIIIFPLVALGIGIFIASWTNYAILLVALAGGIIAILYSFGPIPISHTPLGEVASGITMGMGITVTTAYIQAGKLGVDLFAMALPTTIYIGYIMFTNNLCDRESDIDAKRYTLTGILGFEKSKWLWILAPVVLSFVTAFLLYFKIYPPETMICFLVLLQLKDTLHFRQGTQQDFTKKVMMKKIGQIGIQYHVLLILSFFLAWVLKVFI